MGPARDLPRSPDAALKRLIAAAPCGSRRSSIAGRASPGRLIAAAPLGGPGPDPVPAIAEPGLNGRRYEAARRARSSVLPVSALSPRIHCCSSGTTRFVQALDVLTAVNSATSASSIPES